MATGRRALILDTDIGSDVDDLLALALAIKIPEVDVLAVTTVSGNTSLRACIAENLLALAGTTSVRVYAGATEPLGPGFGFIWFGTEGDNSLIASPRTPQNCIHAVEAIASIIKARSDVEIVSIGPLTNIALVVTRYPELIPSIRRLTIMGGNFGAVPFRGHNLPPIFDYNLNSDPRASATVLRCGVPIQLVLAATAMDAILLAADVASIAATGGALQVALGGAVTRWTPVLRAIMAGFGVGLPDDTAAFLHDPVAMSCAFDLPFCSWVDILVELRLQDDQLTLRPVDSASPDSVLTRCAVAIDTEAFRHYFLKNIASE